MFMGASFAVYFILPSSASYSCRFQEVSTALSRTTPNQYLNSADLLFKIVKNHRLEAMVTLNGRLLSFIKLFSLLQCFLSSLKSPQQSSLFPFPFPSTDLSSISIILSPLSPFPSPEKNKKEWISRFKSFCLDLRELQ